MRLRIVAKGLTLTERLRSNVDRRIRFVLARYGPRVRSATVRVEGPGTDDKDRRVRCRITIQEKTGRDLVAESSDQDINTAVAVASEQSGWQMEHSAMREREAAGQAVAGSPLRTPGRIH